MSVASPTESRRIESEPAMSKMYRASVVLAIFVVGGQGSALAQSEPAAASPVPAVASQEPLNPSLGATFKSIGGDLRRMFTTGSVPMTIAFAGSAVLASQWDRVAVGEVRELPSNTFTAGNRT